MKQMGLAMFNYESAQGSLPMGGAQNGPQDAANNCKAPGGANREWGALAMMLGYMEQSNIYNSLNFQWAAGGGFLAAGSRDAAAVQYTGCTAKVASYICPSDTPITFVNDVTKLGTSSYYSQTSYFPSGGTWNTIAYYDGPGCWQNDVGNGAFDDSTSYKISDFTDGTSNTIFAGEASRFLNDTDTAFNQWTRFEYFGSKMFKSSNRPQGLLFEVPIINSPAVDGALPPGCDYPCNSDYKFWSFPENAANYKYYGAYAFRSNHPGGANFLFGDGSVKFLKQTINQLTYMALGTRANGEVISADSY